MCGKLWAQLNVLVEAMQSMDHGGTGAEAVIAYLCLGQNHNFSQYFH